MDTERPTLAEISDIYLNAQKTIEETYQRKLFELQRHHEGDLRALWDEFSNRYPEWAKIMLKELINTSIEIAVKQFALNITIDPNS